MALSCERLTALARISRATVGIAPPFSGAEWVLVALPHELTGEQRVELTREFAQRLADTYGIAVDYAIHSPGKAGDHAKIVQ